MSGYWSYRQPTHSLPAREGVLASLGVASTSPSLQALAALPTALSLQQEEELAIDDSPEAGDDDTTVKLLGAVEHSRDGASHNDTVADITPSPREASSLFGHDGEEAHLMKEVDGGAVTEPISSGHELDLEGVARQVQERWWLSTLGVDIRPVNPFHRPQTPCTSGEDAEEHLSRQCTPVETEGKEPVDDDIVACARELLRPLETVQVGKKATTERLQSQRKPKLTVPRPFAFHTARAAARREISRVDEAATAPATSGADATSPNAVLPAREEAHVNPTAPVPSQPQPAFLRRMQERATKRRAAHEELQHRQREREEESERAAVAAAAAERESKSRRQQETIVRDFLEHTREGKEDGACTSEGLGRAETDSSPTPLVHYLSEVVDTLLRHSCDATAYPSADDEKVRRAPRLQLHRELALVADHYHACRQAQSSLQRWRFRAKTAITRWQLAQDSLARFTEAVQLLCSGEAEERACLVEQEEHIDRSVLVTAFRRQSAYELVRFHRQRRERASLRWSFVKWIALVEEVRDGRRASAYREHLLRCAQEVLRGLTSSSDEPMKTASLSVRYHSQ